ncbi:MAG: amidohydrolase family protein [Caulobacterales bacterium]
MREIAIHGHIVFEGTLGLGNDDGPAYRHDDGRWVLEAGPYRAIFPGQFNARRVMKLANDPVWYMDRLDEANIERLGISSAPMLHFEWADAETAVSFIRAQNNCMAMFCAARPDRLSWSPSAPLQNIKEAVAEVKRCAAMGSRTVTIGANATKRLGEREMWPLYQAMTMLDLAIVLQPAEASGAFDGMRAFACNRLSSQAAYDVIESMIFAGVFDDFPTLQVHFPRGVWTASQADRVVERLMRHDLPGDRCCRSPHDYLKNFSFVGGPQQAEAGVVVGGGRRAADWASSDNWRGRVDIDPASPQWPN